MLKNIAANTNDLIAEASTALRHCRIYRTPDGCATVFADGSVIASFPHDIPHYYVISHRCGYGDDILAYCREHDFFHSFCEDYFNDRPSPVLLSLAHGGEIKNSMSEEIIVQTCQRWVRAHEQPIIGNVDWGEFKRVALGHLDLWNSTDGCRY